MPSSTEPPGIATHLLRWTVPENLQETLLGDLVEEFLQRTQVDPQQAKNWYWRQSMTTSIHYVTRYITSEDLLRRLTILVAMVLFPALVSMIAWLSSMDSASEHIWQNLLLGKVHAFLFESEVLVNGSGALISSAEIGMYINVPSILWALLTFSVLYLRNRFSDFSAHQAAGWGLAMMLSPYVFGMIYIDIIHPEPKQIGPTVAFMTISIVYIILPLAWFILRKSKNTRP